ncbi:MAG: hypothetical protein V4640_05700 [Verrucomicrobiota bacterium]
MAKTVWRSDADARLTPAAQSIKIASRLFQLENHTFASSQEKFALRGDANSLPCPVEQAT